MIQYNEEINTIEFSGEITSYSYYHEMFGALREHYRLKGRDIIPIFSFICVEKFDSTVLPNLLGLGIILKKIHGGKRIPLRLARVSSTRFLDSTKFFDNVGEEKIIEEEFSIEGLRVGQIKKIGLSIFDFDPACLGFYNNQNNQFDYNKEHKIQIFTDSSYEYYKNYSEIADKKALDNVLDTIRTQKYNDLKPVVEKYFYNILYYNNRSQSDVNDILQILTEIICNSVLYSGSICAAMLQSKDRKTTISISDFGVGFEYSFNQKPNFKFLVSETYQGKDKDKLRKYLLIFDALEFSKNKKRENLYTLLNLIIRRGGKMRIHYDNVQVIFTSNRCQKCEIIEPINCSKCLLNSLSHDKLISPVRFFDSKFQGIHIEVELNF